MAEEGRSAQSRENGRSRSPRTLENTERPPRGDSGRWQEVAMNVLWAVLVVGVLVGLPLIFVFMLHRGSRYGKPPGRNDASGEVGIGERSMLVCLLLRILL